MIQLEAPRFEDRKSFLLAGLSERYLRGKIEGIPGQWMRFAPSIGKIPGQKGGTSYGVCFNFDSAGNMDYLCGVEIADDAVVPEGLVSLRVAEQRYAVFSHREHISKIAATWDAIMRHWLKESGHKMVMAPQFETYDERFDPQSGNGVVEIWIPIEK